MPSGAQSPATTEDGAGNRDEQVITDTVITARVSFLLTEPVVAPPQVETFAPETIDSRIGKLSFTKDFENGYPTDATVTKLYDEMDFQRASQAYMWSIPLVSFVWWQHHQDEVMGTKNGQLVFAETYDEKFAALEDAGVKTVRSLADIGSGLAEITGW